MKGIKIVAYMRTCSLYEDIQSIRGQCMDLPRTYKHRILCIALEHDNAPLMTTLQFDRTYHTCNKQKQISMKKKVNHKLC